MHELSIAEALAEQVNVIASREKGQITSITISIGALSGVDAEALDQAFKIVTEDTPLENSTLAIKKEPARIICHACNRESAPDFPAFACQLCGSLDFEVVSGRDMLLKSVEVSS